MSVTQGWARVQQECVPVPLVADGAVSVIRDFAAGAQGPCAMGHGRAHAGLRRGEPSRVPTTGGLTISVDSRICLLRYHTTGQRCRCL